MNFNIDPVWEQVASKGYYVIKNVGVSEKLKSQALNETFAPYGLNPMLNMNKSALHPFYMTDMDYDVPENHKEPDYLTEICKKCLSEIPDSKYKNSWDFHTSDMVKYIYAEDPTNNGPYSYHYDFFPRLPYMFFFYASKYKDILDIYVYDSADAIQKCGRDAINAFVTGDEQQQLLRRIEQFSCVKPFNSKEARRRIALRLIEENKYCY